MPAADRACSRSRPAGSDSTRCGRSNSDPLAVGATLANERRNRVGLRVGRRTIGADALPAAGVVVANLTATVLAALAGALPRPAPRRLVASGLRPHEVSATVARFAPLGLSPARRIVDGGWATVLLDRRMRHTFRYLVTEAPEAGAEVTLSPGDSHHVTRVVRLRPGDTVELIDGVGTRWAAVLVEAGDRARVRVQAATAVPRRPCP